MIESLTRDILLEVPYYTEGPVMDAHGNAFVTTLTGGQILKILPNLEIQEWAHCTSPNGQGIASNGDHLVCNSLEGSIERFDSAGRQLKTWFKGPVSKELVKCPNDLWINGDGSLFFTDSLRENGAVIYVDAGGRGQRLVGQLDYPNGIVYHAQNNCLYVAESYKNRILRLDLKPSLPELSVLLDLPQHPSEQENQHLPDGLALHGNELWIAHYGMTQVHCYDLQAKVLRSYDSQMPLTSNVFVHAQGLVITGGLGEPGPGRIRMLSR